MTAHHNKDNFNVPAISDLSPAHQGWLLIIGGALLLAHTMGLLGSGITFALGGLAIYMMFIGFFKTKLHVPLQNTLSHWARKK